MNKNFNLLLCFFFFASMNAQIHEVGIFLGGSNYMGDVGNTTYIASNKPALGILYRWNKSPRHAYRFSYTQSTIAANDSDSKEGGRKPRGYSFENTIREVSAGLEFNFFDFNLHEMKRKFTPYIFSGVNYFIYDTLHLQSGEIKKKTEAGSGSFAIPMILGIKADLSDNFVLGLEVGARYTFTNNLDGSNAVGSGLMRFGDFNNNDWYVFSGITLTYTFGNKFCYCPY